MPYLHDLRDVPRPFVIEPPLETRTHYRAGEALELTLVLIGRGIDFLPYFTHLSQPRSVSVQQAIAPTQRGW
ncbi:MAG: hypothetical protein EI684_18955 [Candidatus Viridilinea halotolerans]|uniref:Uncharacterized protein n=1 Tax=Candidatus Viridilinea halotolerans TaxID=2491704 RepID=A0A426TT14_9CHLR|nr:MAG: hypothetical protein EI684_18955 [Candidatus Viridilinea halotolerans]